jgi:lipid-A-disaccharide synthase
MSAGEPSGVNIAATLMRTLKTRCDDIEFAGLGGEPMIAEGLRQIDDTSQSATMWLWGNVKRVPAHYRALKRCVADWEAYPPAVMTTVDYQAFHLYMGTRAKKRGIPVVHYVSSQFWARRYFTLETIRRAYSHVLCIHEFEKKYYDAAGIPATFVGHPLFERLEARSLDQGLVDRIKGLKQGDRPLVGILPGSRGSEIRYALPVMLNAAKRLQPAPKVVVSAAHPRTRERLETMVRESRLDAEIVDYGSGEILSAVDLSFITSGSASMEAVYYGCPAVVLYRCSPLSYFFAHPMVTSYIAQPNLVADREIVPEFLLTSQRGVRVSQAAQNLLDQPAARDAQIEAFREMRERLLGGRKPSELAADVVLGYLDR